MNNLQIISAGAGSGKTYRLTSELVRLLGSGVRAGGIIATTFTQKAAAELQERVRVRLLAAGMVQQAEDLNNALIGTVHSLGVKLLRRFAYEAGVSPEVSIIAEEDQQLFFNQALASVLSEERVVALDRLSERLGLSGNIYFDWRKEVRKLTDVARSNDFDEEVLRASSLRSVETLSAYLGKMTSATPVDLNAKLTQLLAETLERIAANGDQTITTANTVKMLQECQRDLRLRGELNWRQWAALGKTKVAVKSREDAAALIEFARTHDAHPQFRADIEAYITQFFDLAIAALNEYASFKKKRGLIDYTDMEVMIKRLLDHPVVQQVLQEELDLLLVDEFQDTNPIQLEIFLKLSRLANHSIWVGDPKQSIYGFRGAAPELMQAIIEETGGIRLSDIQTDSWRSREDIVYAVNALFTKAFPQLPVEQVALEPRRRKAEEPREVLDAVMHWHFMLEEDEDGGNRRAPGRAWLDRSIAEYLAEFLEDEPLILPKGSKEYRAAQPGDVAILCRSNKGCQEMAEALSEAGFSVAISRAGLLQTAEAKLVLACLKYLLHYQDSLSIAEILLLGGRLPIEDILEDRIAYLSPERKEAMQRWAQAHPLIQRLDYLRTVLADLSSSEILDLLLAELDLRRQVIAWGNAEQRLDNIDVVRRLALQYEEACSRLHTATSLGGFLLWLQDLEANERDWQGSGENAGAVNVLTYHKSKGLEWPIVICHHLDAKLRADLWGMDILSDTTEVDLDHLLANRWLRYWVNPYDKQYPKTPLAERLEASPEQAHKTKQALAEENRLLYVGMTRARDYLVLPSGKDPLRVINRAWHEGQEDWPVLDPDQEDSPWEWAEEMIPVTLVKRSFPREIAAREAPFESIAYLESRVGTSRHPSLVIDPEREGTGNQVLVTLREQIAYGQPLLLQPLDDENSYQLGKAAKAFLTAFHADYPTTEHVLVAEELLTHFKVADQLDTSQLIDWGKQWSQMVTNQFSPRMVYRKYPLRHWHRERLFQTIADIVMETEQGLVIIQHSGFRGDAKKIRQKAQSLGGWFQYSKAALQQLFGTPRVRCYLHFVLAGVMIEVDTDWSPQALTLFDDVNT